MNLSFLSSSSNDWPLALQDKLLCLSDLLLSCESSCSYLRESVASAGFSIQQSQGELKQTLQEKAEAPNSTIPSPSNSDDCKNLRLLREHLEENIVNFKLKVANIKSQLESFQDIKTLISQEITAKDQQIQGLTQQANLLKAEKHALIVRHSHEQVSSQRRNNKQALLRQSFDKHTLKPYPVSSFQVALSAETERIENLNASIADIRSTRSFWTEGSSRYY